MHKENSLNKQSDIDGQQTLVKNNTSFKGDVFRLVGGTIIAEIIGIITVVLSAAYSFGGEKIINPKGATVNAKQVYEPEICQNTYRYYSYN